MADDTDKNGSPDRDRINIDANYEVHPWTGSPGVSAAQWREAVQAVGPTAAAVRRHLGK